MVSCILAVYRDSFRAPIAVYNFEGFALSFAKKRALSYVPDTCLGFLSVTDLRTHKVREYRLEGGKVKGVKNA